MMLGMIKMLPLLLVVCGAAYGYHNNVVNQKDTAIAQQQTNIVTLQNNVIRLETALERSEQSLKTAEENFKKQQLAIGEMTAKNEALARERDEYLSVFKRHDLTKLARLKPGLIEPRINKGTEGVFRQIEEDSKEVADADS